MRKLIETAYLHSKAITSTMAAAALMMAYGAHHAVAQTTVTPVTVQTMPTITQFQSIGGTLGVICGLLNWVYTIALLLSIIFVLIAAFKYMTSGGDPEKTKSAKNNIVYAAIGIAVAIIAKGFPAIVGSFFLTGADNFAVCK